MKVTLRKRQKNSGNISLYLDIYHKGQRKTEYLRLYVLEKPKTALDRKQNKETYQLAENIRAKRQLELQNNVYGFDSPTLLATRFLSYFDKFKETKTQSINNYNNWKSALRHLQNWDKSDINFSQLDFNWLEELKYYLLYEAKTKSGKRLANNTSLSYFNKVLATLKEAEKDGVIKSNPGRFIKSIKEEETQREFLSKDELIRLSKTPCEMNVMKNAFLFSALTGLRFSDIVKLKWDEVYYSKEVGHYIRFKQQKTKGQETLPISEDAVSLIGENTKSNKLVFNGLKYSDFYNKKIKIWMTDAGISKHITFHCARHTNATLLMALGENIYTVKNMLGHKSIKTTERYAKMVDSKKIDAAKRIKL